MRNAWSRRTPRFRSDIANETVTAATRREKLREREKSERKRNACRSFPRCHVILHKRRRDTEHFLLRVSPTTRLTAGAHLRRTDYRYERLVYLHVVDIFRHVTTAVPVPVPAPSRSRNRTSVSFTCVGCIDRHLCTCSCA